MKVAWLLVVQTLPCLGFEFHFAPMQGYTDRHLRFLFRLLLPEAVVWTEMLKPSDLITASPAKQRRLLERGRESEVIEGRDARCVLQFGGDDPDELVGTDSPTL